MTLQDTRWIGGKKADESRQLFQKHISLFASHSSIQQLLTSKSKVGIPQSPPSSNQQLAAKACLLYLERLLASKRLMKARICYFLYFYFVALLQASIFF